MFWKRLLGLDWSCGRCNIVTRGKNYGEIKFSNKWEPMCKSCGTEMVEIIRIKYPQYEY